MNNKLEKYYNYIVDDLVKNTEIINEYDEYCEIVIDTEWTTDCFDDFIYSLPSFCEYIEYRYGARKDDCHPIWDLYIGKILKLTKTKRY